MWAWLARLCRHQRGNVATLFALTAPVLIGVAALAVDEAALYLERRKLQAAADMAAIYATAAPHEARERVALALADAGYALPDEAIAVTTGHYRASATLAPDKRFVADAKPANAVRVALTGTGQLHFASIFGLDAPEIGVSATAAATPLAAYSIGSRLASVNAGMLNAVLGGLLGTELDLTLLDYNAIASLDVDLLTFLDALAGEIDIEAGTYGDLLASRVTLGDLALALASASNGNAVLVELAGLIDNSIELEMLDLIGARDIGHLALGSAAAVEARIDALELLSAAALIADGSRHFTLDLGADVPGLVGIDVALVVGEPPQTGWFTLADAGSYLRTAQTRLRLDVSLSGAAGSLGLLSAKLPIYAELAPGEAHLESLSCPPGRPDLGRATVAARPGILRLAIGQTPSADFLDTTRPLTVSKGAIGTVLGGAARLTAHADIAMAQTAAIPLHFTAADAASGTVRTVSTTTPLESLTASLFDTVELEFELLRLNPLGGLLPDPSAAVSGLLSPLPPLLDQVLVALFDALGLGLGELDVAVHAFDCRNAALVQ